MVPQMKRFRFDEFLELERCDCAFVAIRGGQRGTGCAGVSRRRVANERVVRGKT